MNDHHHCEVDNNGTHAHEVRCGACSRDPVTAGSSRGISHVGHAERSECLDEIRERHYKLDAFKWIRDEELDDPDVLPEPEELITEAMEELRLALDDLGDMHRLLTGNGPAE